MAHATRTPRPHRIVTRQAIERDAAGNTHLVWDQFGNPVLTEDVEEYGRRAGLHTSKSQTTYARVRMNRNDRAATRRQLRRDPELVELRQARARCIWSTR